MTLSEWIQTHPFLARIAELQTRLDAAAAAFAPPAASPALDAYAPDHAEGVPLLHSARAALDLAPAAALLRSLAADLSTAPIPPSLAREAAELAADLAKPADAAARTIAWVARGEGSAPARHAGLARYLGWTALARALDPVKAAYAGWRHAEGWRHPYCPTCGAQPSMAALVPEGAGRARLLCCGQCRTRWQWQRLGCPHCGNESQERIELLELEGDDGLRIDGCRSCSGYVKTVTREPIEPFLLDDWTTLHLDALARERGMERKGASLYEL